MGIRNGWTVLLGWVLGLAGVWAQLGPADRRLFTVNDVTVIHHYIPNGVVAVELVFRQSGTVYGPPGKEAIGILALATVLEGGTRTYPREKFQELLARRGVRMTYYATPEYVAVRWEYPADEQQFLVSVFTELFTRPLFDSLALEEAKRAVAARIRRRSEVADAVVADKVYAHVGRLIGYPYHPPYGTIEALPSFRLEEVRTYYFDRLLNASALVLAIVGERPYDQVKEWAQRVLPRIPKRRSIPPPKVPLKPWLGFADNRLVRIPAALPHPTVVAVLGSASPVDSAAEALQMAINAFNDRIVLGKYILRHMQVDMLPDNDGPAYVFPHSLIGVQIECSSPEYGARKVKQWLDEWYRDGISAIEVSSIQSLMATSHAVMWWSNANLAHFYAHYHVIYGDWLAKEKALRRVKLLTAAEINRTVRRRLQGIRWIYLGPDGLLEDTTVFYRPLGEK